MTEGGGGVRQIVTVKCGGRGLRGNTAEGGAEVDADVSAGVDACAEAGACWCVKIKSQHKTA